MIATVLDKIIAMAKANGQEPVGLILGRGVRRMLASEVMADPSAVPLRGSPQGWGFGTVITTYDGLPITQVDALCSIDVVMAPLDAEAPGA